MDWVMGHWVKIWSVVSTWALHKWHVVSMDEIRAAKVSFVGRMSHANFQRRFLWRGLILAFQRVFQSDLSKGPVVVNLSLWSVR
jgi:hypothetical protein